MGAGTDQSCGAQRLAQLLCRFSVERWYFDITVADGRHLAQSSGKILLERGAYRVQLQAGKRGQGSTRPGPSRGGARGGGRGNQRAQKRTSVQQHPGLL